MAGNIKGLTVEINGETTGLEAALKNVSQATRDIDRELKEVERSLKLDPGNVVLLAQKQDLLREKIEQTKLRLDALRQAQERVKQMYEAGEIDEGQYRAFQRDVETTRAKLDKYEKELADVGQASETASRKTTGLRSAVKELARQVGATAGGFVLGQAIINVGQKAKDLLGDTIGAASDLNEAISKVDVVFGDSAGRVQAWAQTAADAFGQSRLQALEAAGTYGNLLVAMGLTGDEAAKMSMRMVELASDLASFNNASPQEALDALRSGLVGETEPLKRFGVNLNEATLKAKALELGLWDGKDALDAGAKAQAAYAIILEQTKTAQGDFARTSDGAANKQRILQARMEDLKASIGQGLLPVYNALLTVVNKVVGFFNRMPGPMKAVVAVIAALAAGLTVLTPILAAFSAVQWAALAPVLAVVAAIGALVAIVIVCIKYHEQIKAALIAAWNAIKGAMIAAWNAIKGAAEAVWGALKSFFSTIWDGLQAAWDAVWGALSGALQAVWGGLKAAGETIWNGLKSFFEAIWNGLQAAWDAVWGAIKSVLERVWSAIKAVADFLWGPIITFFSKVWDDPKAAWDAAWNEIRERLEAAWKAIKGALDAAWQAIKDAWDSVMSWLREIPGKIKGVFADAGSWLIEHGRSVINGLWNGLKNVWETVTGWFKGLGGTVKNLLSDAGSWLVETGKAILRGMWDGMVSIKDWLWNKIKGLKDTIVGWFKGLFGISSPSKVMFELGEFTMQGFVEGLKGTIPEIARTLSALEMAVPAVSSQVVNNTGPKVTIGSIVVNGGRQEGEAAATALLTRLRAAGVI